MSCRKKQEPASPVNEYKLTGQVMRLDAQHRFAVIKHQKIEGWMGAMTMEFPVKDAGDFQKLKPGGGGCGRLCSFGPPILNTGSRT